MKILRVWCVTTLLVVVAVCRLAAQSDSGADQPPEPTGAQSGTPSPPPDTKTTPESDTPTTPASEGKQGGRMFGVLPNYATVEGASAIMPISPREKFALARMNSFDPFLFPLVGVMAAVQRSYGPGALNYAKQYAASFGDNTIGNTMTTGVFPSMLHQDPRYFQRGHGSVMSRVGYAASRLLITHGDSGHRQFNLSEVGGTATGATISNAYYPASARGVSDTMSRWGMQMMWDGLTNELKEFWPDVRRMMTKDKSGN